MATKEIRNLKLERERIRARHVTASGTFTVRQLSPALGAEILGVDLRTLLGELKSGKSITQVAQEHGKTKQQVKDAVIAKVTAKLDAEVAAGHITAEIDHMEADAALLDLPEDIEGVESRAEHAVELWRDHHIAGLQYSQ